MKIKTIIVSNMNTLSQKIKVAFETLSIKRFLIICNPNLLLQGTDSVTPPHPIPAENLLPV